MSPVSLRRLSTSVCLTAVMILAGCHKKTPPPPTPPPPAPAPPASPTASISASPNVIEQGQATTLTWSTANANDVTVTSLGKVPVINSQVVTPSESTTYTVTAKGPGGTVEESARVTVNKPTPVAAVPPSMTEEELFEQNVHDIYFGYDKYDIASTAQSTVEADASFLEKHPDMKVVIGGHCDERGSEEYNLALGQDRAQALKEALVAQGVPASRIRVISYGKEKPFCTDEDEACWQKNRVDHLKLDQGQ